MKGSQRRGARIWNRGRGDLHAKSQAGIPGHPCPPGHCQVPRRRLTSAMVSQADAVFQEALQLPEEVRMDLVERLIISMPGYRDIEEEQIEIARKRLSEMRSGTIAGVPGDLVLARVQASLDARRKS
ncbi:MAG: hypothetical protein B9S38_03090 [Verrucomicrobiia bacterium Tous-C4TDCM]|nr:MAG: hypothetical protein B9S38_03090 [Verrucomicrobiae bacterium Tous-C4TDCM]